MAQNWELTLVLDPIAPVSGVGNTDSAGGGDVGTPKFWELSLFDGNPVVSDFGNTTSIGVGTGVADNALLYTISVVVGSGGAGNTLSQAADFAPFTVISPPSVTGVGNTVSSSYGSALRTFNTIGQETEGGFDTSPQTTDSVLIRPTANGDFVIDGLPLPS